MSYENSNPTPDSGAPISSRFSSQTQMGLAEILQMCCLNRRSGQITFRSGESYGFVYIQQGRVLHAMCGVNEGEEAVYLMLSWPGGSFTLDEDILPHKKTVGLTWEQLLFEGARRADFGMTGAKQGSSLTVTTTPIPATSTRAMESQPKLTVSAPDQAPVVFELDQEYTHAGRSTGNEICLPYPSISNRHCIFVVSGPDVIVRDLNSSNGTLVNGETITEAILRPGDTIQIGVVQIRFEPGMKRPKLTNFTNPLPAPRREGAGMQERTTNPLISTRVTSKLPTPSNRSSEAATVKDDSVYVTGQSAISYEDLAKPETASEEKPWVKIVAGIFVLLLIVGGVYWFFLRH